MAGGDKLTEEEELLLQTFSRNLSAKSYALLYANAFFVSAIPLCEIAQRRNATVARELNMETSPNKKLTRQEKDERILWKKNKVAETEAISFSIFYNNSLYLFLILIASFYVLRTFNPAGYP
ncbi:Translocon-associated protein subunit gamma [Acropora cervicornis]|uniref:Translocon-associated protein subunit gamma n=1 Tax=Acropora cervicornis TaxID=6130 RepID=A0AAD9V132_ACRCE|nr:Translocon-associated protein subunit gamma [Acropora cervicornis]